MLSYLLLIVLGFLVVARVTRFVNDDVLAAPIRAWVIRRWGDDGRMAYLMRCPWCLSIWTAAPVAVYVALEPDDGWGQAPRWAVAVGLWLGYSYLYGLVAQNLDGE